MRITKQSYDNLLAANEPCWYEDEKYYSSPQLISEENASLFEEAQAFVLYDYYKTTAEPQDFPSHIIFPIQLDFTLYKKTYRNLGERLRTVYYASYDETTGEHSEEVIKVEYEFTRDADGLLIKRDRVIHWMLKNGEWSSQTKTITKYFSNTLDKVREITTRRKNLIDELKSLAEDAGLSQQTEELFERYAVESDIYINTGSRLLIDAITADAAPWLDVIGETSGVPIRQTILFMLEIGAKAA